MTALASNFEDGTNEEMVTTANTIFDGIGYEAAPVLESSAIFGENAHSGSLAVTAVFDDYEHLFTGISFGAVSATEHTYNVWLAFVGNTGDNTTVYEMWCAPLGISDRLGSVDRPGVRLMVERQASTLEWIVEFDDADLTGGDATQVTITTPHEWVEMRMVFNALGFITLGLYGEDGELYDEAVSPHSTFEWAGPDQHFCYDVLTVTNMVGSYGYLSIDDVRVDGGVIAGPSGPPEIITSIFFPPTGQKVTSILAQWVPPYGEPVPTSYEIGIGLDYSQAQDNAITVPGNVTKYNFKGLNPNTSYRVSIRPLNGTDAAEWTQAFPVVTKVPYGIQPRYAEFVWLKYITDKWTDWEEVNGNDVQPDFYDGGRVLNG